MEGRECQPVKISTEDRAKTGVSAARPPALGQESEETGGGAGGEKQMEGSPRPPWLLLGWGLLEAMS